MNEYPENLSITTSREINATPRDVFLGLTDESLMEKWFCPLGRGYTAEVDFPAAIGGMYEIDMVDANGTTYTHSGMIEEMVPAKKLVLTWSSDSVSDSIVTFTINPRTSGTEVELTHQFNEPDDISGHKEAWDELLENLRRMLEE